jgi:hypothetical protein
LVAVHRDTDLRACGATTIVSNQSTVTANQKLIAVEGDECTHGNGDLVSTSAGTVTVENKKLIVITDTAVPDDVPHPPPDDDPDQGSPTVNAY